jgi:alkanesulfonate monooxygenase SsuD/methylene tetrahydromethanopterin reductase-like flavin-dependent oxidoreductase (luciferase family)
MEFGIQFFPDVGPDVMSAADYWADALHLCSLVDDLGYTNIRTVEHYFESYGGYSPNPIVFLAAAAMAAPRARLITGAVLPAFNNPMKIAGEVGMLDAISQGRLEVGFARAFLPHEFRRFGVALDESRARFDEGMEMVRRMLEEEHVSMEGRFHTLRDVTSLPRPTQQPRPPFWIAALATPASFEFAGRAGHGVMAIPMTGGAMKDLLATYREAWKSAGHGGQGRVMLAFHMLCHESHEAAVAIAHDPLNRYLKSLVAAAGAWLEGTASDDYPGYDKIIRMLDNETFESMTEKGAAWVGTPAALRDQVRDYNDQVGGFEIASLQVSFNTISRADAEASMRLFAAEVMPDLGAPS